MSYNQLLDQFYDRDHVIFTLKDGSIIERRVDDIENVDDGWDSPMFMIYPGSQGDEGLPVSDIKSVKLA